jgi:hypothetical protein
MNWQSVLGWATFFVGIVITVAGAVTLGSRLRQRRQDDHSMLAAQVAVVSLGVTLIGTGAAWLNR